jgi:hypothetical protein
MRLTIHDQVRVRVNGMDARVDIGMADLLRECWRAGIYTTMSCENQGRIDGAAVDMAWLQLPGPSAEGFIDIISADLIDGTPAERELFCHIHHSGIDPERERSWWRYQVSPRYVGERVRLVVSIRFPVADLPLLTARLRDHNRAVRHAVNRAVAGARPARREDGS